MAVTAYASGTQTATVTTEHELPDGDNVKEAGVFVFLIDTSAMVAGDVLELRIYKIALTGGTPRIVAFAQFCGAQPAHDVMKVSLPMSNSLAEADALKFTLKQTFGTGRDFPWSILKHA
jgi:hypothetical protein